MKIGLYDPYLNTMGGGEKYMFDAAAYLSKQHEVFFFWQPPLAATIRQQAHERFSVDLTKVAFVKDIFSTHTSPWEKLQMTSQFDYLFYLSDGSFPFLFAKKNIIMFQHPIDWVEGQGFFTKLKLTRIQTIVCNSEFTKSHVDKTFGREATVIYPCVTSVKQEGIVKEKIILSVGRFTKAMNAKKQDILIKAFKKLYENEKEWKLVLVGGVQTEDLDVIDDLRKQSEGYPIEIHVNITHEKIVAFYNKATIYWHAAGFGEDFEQHPERTEHFGISTVEAMTAGCVPIVFKAGGSAEIVKDEMYGLLWETTSELIAKTRELITNTQTRSELIKAGSVRVNEFGEKVFQKSLDSLFAV